MFFLMLWMQWQIETVHGSADEEQIKQTLIEAIQQYELEPYLFTQTMRVDARAKTPHSHPVLTMNTADKYLTNRDLLISVFLHEHFHWHLEENGNLSPREMAKEIKQHFPHVKSQRPYGSGGETSTLNHLLVCYLEYRTVCQLFGPEAGKRAIQKITWYTWVYEQVLNPENHPKFEALLNQFDLNLDL